MKKINSFSWMLVASGLFLFSCNNDQEKQVVPDTEVSAKVISQLQNLGFRTTEGLHKVEDGYVVENDIFLSEQDLQNLVVSGNIPLASEEQYSTHNLVTGMPRVIRVYVDSKFKEKYFLATDAALDRYNNEGLEMTFQRVSKANQADIVIKPSPRYYAWKGILGSAGFPTDSGDPYGRILLTAAYYDQVEDLGDLTTTIAHEIGHTIGLRHTDYMDRSYSCGGELSDEGASSIGANHIPGTPETPDKGSWMLACSDGTDKPFTSSDKVALDYLY